MASRRAGGQGRDEAQARSALECLLPTAQLLRRGGDERIDADVAGTDRYGGLSQPDPGLAAFGSSTASTISQAGWNAAEQLHRRIADDARRAPAETYRRETDRVRAELTALCGLSDLAGLRVVLGASGTDIHLLAREIAAGGGDLLCLTASGSETGRGVGAAVAARRFAARTPLDGPCRLGHPVHSNRPGATLVIEARDPDGALRPDGVIEQELHALIAAAAAAGRRVLLVAADVSKTGLIFPSLSLVAGLRARWPSTVRVLIDACQFRLAPATLRAYLRHGFVVAVTGSKFLTGPVFSGALFLPADGDAAPLPAALGAYSARADWPRGCLAAEGLPAIGNFGLLLRWEAALEELRRFSAIPAGETEAFLARFEAAVADRLARDSGLHPLPVPTLDRSAIGAPPGWDRTQTIFPFTLGDLDAAGTARVHRELAAGDSRVQFGQPVACGRRAGQELAALRICASSRLVVEAAAGPAAADAVIARAMSALDRAAALACGKPRVELAA